MSGDYTQDWHRRRRRRFYGLGPCQLLQRSINKAKITSCFESEDNGRANYEAQRTNHKNMTQRIELQASLCRLVKTLKRRGKVIREGRALYMTRNNSGAIISVMP